jgi:hypothetical protein
MVVGGEVCDKFVDWQGPSSHYGIMQQCCWVYVGYAVVLANYCEM